ncbi:hypothetical protein PENANT_c028G03371 [Penicillium antarcticum]|uniref:Uncharacterized protein n=1 Tax=Penicillium antarcticum TaxID=416450 RepID=A0A1V6PX99_9EURO|nr:hypothetical protein PENANT_c028G03371 [Penicillium antarcticum]
MGGNNVFIELEFASNSRANLAEELGWTAKAGLTKLEAACLDEVKTLMGETDRNDTLLAKATVAKKKGESRSV